MELGYPSSDEWRRFHIATCIIASCSVDCKRVDRLRQSVNNALLQTINLCSIFPLAIFREILTLCREAMQRHHWLVNVAQTNIDCNQSNWRILVKLVPTYLTIGRFRLRVYVWLYVYGNAWELLCAQWRKQNVCCVGGVNKRRHVHVHVRTRKQPSTRT